MAADAPTVHASAVLAGARAVLIRGPAGAGKSQLALALLHAADTGLLRFARLVGDDRLHLEACHGRLLARPAASLAGLIEVRGLGIRRLAFEPVAVVGLVIDLAADDAERLPAAGREAVISGISLPRLAVASGIDPLPAAVALLGTADNGS
jgi:HPr kinase/phosphorylase